MKHGPRNLVSIDICLQFYLTLKKNFFFFFYFVGNDGA
jgi:hypothetical protein